MRRLIHVCINLLLVYFYPTSLHNGKYMRPQKTKNGEYLKYFSYCLPCISGSMRTVKTKIPPIFIHVKGCSSGKGDVDAFMPGADLGCGGCFAGLSASVFKGL